MNDMGYFEVDCLRSRLYEMVSTWWAIAGLLIVLVLIEVATGFLREVGSRLFQLCLNLIQRFCNRYSDQKDATDARDNQGEPMTIFDVGENSTVNVMMGNQDSQMPIDQDFDSSDKNGS